MEDLVRMRCDVDIVKYWLDWKEVDGFQDVFYVILLRLGIVWRWC